MVAAEGGSSRCDLPSCLAPSCSALDIARAGFVVSGLRGGIGGGWMDDGQLFELQ